VVLHGKRDEVISPRAAEYAAGKIPGARMRWLPDVGHMPFAERPAEFDAALRELAESASH
jgi:pimeloyl-ACP methyl ester carboxylesterase